jgi:hypothetical protein
MTDLRKRIAFAISDPGNSGEGYKGDRTLTEWQTDAVMRAIKERKIADKKPLDA